MSYTSDLQNNNVDLQAILDKVNKLPSSKLPELNNPADSSKILEEYESVDDKGNLLVGSMPNQGSKSATLGFGEEFTIEEGYHDGTGKVTSSGLPELNNPAGAAQILVGYEAIDGEGNKITGTAVSVKAASGTINSTNSKTITISGLDFQPSKIFLLSKGGTSTNKAVDGIGYMGGMDCSLSVMGDNYQRYPYRNGGMFTVTPSSDGFTATINSSFDATFKTGPYYWMAME